jgi:pyridoxamine 5'-phosphate oxidase
VQAPLPELLPDNPLPLLQTWLDEAAAAARNPTAMTLATVTPEGRPAARMVICRGLDARAGWLVFYTDRESDKGAQLRERPHAAVVFHWEALERQVRIDGPVTRASDADSDRYWATRPLEARAAAAASRQSRPLASRAELLARVAEEVRRGGDTIARPARWGGYRIWLERLELWVGQPARVHDRARWSRELRADGDGYAAGPWRATRLMP